MWIFGEQEGVNMTLTKVVHDCSTGETVTIPLTAEEIAAHEAGAVESAQRSAEREAAAVAEASAKDSARAKLAALGLTEAEVAALVR